MDGNEMHKASLEAGSVFEITAGMPFSLAGIEESTLYFFSKNYGEMDAPKTKRNAKNEGVLQMRESGNPAAKPGAKSMDVLSLKESSKFKARKTTDFREKYWGSIETITSGEFCGKKIVMRKGTQNSLEFHCLKHETYYVHSGQVKIGLRVGRAENRSVVLRKGDVFHIPPGLMHMKIATENCVVMEISTKDDDSDSHLVEDGQKYVHKEI
jgi:mannose-6-phosphate isomerase-like protein (cupin superfamily)